MISRRSFCLAPALLVACFIAVPSRAADLTFYAGGISPGSINYQNVKTSLDGSPIYGVRLSTNFVPFFGMEHTFGFSSDFLYPRNISAISEAKGFVYNCNLIVDVPVGKIVPYLTAGAGLIHQYGSQDMPVGTRFAVNYGGGLKLRRLAGPVGLRFDMRGYSATDFSDTLHMFEISGGVVLSIGK
jgi:hypothetical protein